MTHRVRSAVIAVYLLLCIVVGGSSQSAWPGLALQLLGLGLIAWAAICRPGDDGNGSARGLYILLICAFAVILIQLIPLPPALWTKLPGRAPIAQSIGNLGFQLRPAPISETPYLSLLTLFAAIPAIAAFIAAERLSAGSRAIALAIVGGMVGSIVLGAIQVAGGADSWAYFYPIHSAGAVGFFANQNHMATLLLTGIPMAAALIASGRTTGVKSGSRYLIGGALFAVILIGIILTRSRAAIALAVPVIIASVTLFPALAKWRTPALSLSMLGFVAALAAVAVYPINGGAGPSASSSGSRIHLWATTTEAVADNFPLGTGLGSFQKVYHRYEPADDVGRAYVNHAHNDYLEIVSELGVAGLLLVLAFVTWWMATVLQIWKSLGSTLFARAATIASAAILAHSLVDFPIRTAAISASLAACLGLMVRHSRPSSISKNGDSRPSRHVTLR